MDRNSAILYVTSLEIKLSLDFMPIYIFKKFGEILLNIP